MPIYEYQCQKCSTHVEAFQKLRDKPLVKCRKCGGRLEKMVSAPAIQFKGTGWYVTDYSGKGNKSTDKAEKSEGTSPEKASDKKPDKKAKDGSPASKSSTESSSSKVPSSD